MESFDFFFESQAGRLDVGDRAPLGPWTWPGACACIVSFAV